MMKNYDESVKIIHNPNCPSIADHPYIYKIHFHVEDHNKKKKKKKKKLQEFIDYSQRIVDVYENLEEYNLQRKGEC